MKYIYTSILFLFFSQILFSQNENYNENLKNLLKKEQIDSAKIYIMFDLADSYKKNDDSAIFYYNEAISLSQQINNKKLLAESYFRKASFFCEKKYFDKAIGIYKQASNFFLIVDDTIGKAKSYLNIAQIYYYKKMYDSSIFFGINAKKIFEKIKEYKYEISTLELLGQISVEIHLYEDAALYYSEALNYADSIKDLKKKCILYNKLGALYLDINDLDNSLNYLNIAKKLAVDNNFDEQLSDIFFNMGELYLDKNMKNNATSYFIKSKEYYEEFDDKNNLFKVYVKLAELNKEMPFYASGFLKRASSYLNNNIDIRDKVDYYQVLSDINVKQNKYLEAFENLQKCITLKDSFLNEQQIYFAYEMEYKFQTRRKDVTIMHLNEINNLSNQLLQREKEKRKAYRWITILFFILLALLIITLANFYKNIRLNRRLKENNKKLEEAQQKLTHILDAFPEVFLEMDEYSNILYANNSFYKKIEKKKKNKFYFDDYLKSEYLEDFYTIYDSLKEKTGTKKIEAEIKFADGTYKYGIISLTSEKIRDKIVFYANIFDIDEKKQIEKFLKLLNKSIEQSPVGLVITDKDANIIYVNKFYSQVTGYQKHELIGSNIRIMKSGKNSPKLYSEMWSTLLKGQNWSGNILNKKKNGDLYWERNNISPVIDSIGKITNFIATKEDITEELEQNEKILKLYTAAEKSPVSVMILDQNAHITYVNKSFEKITGFKSSEVLGKAPSILNSEKENPKVYENLIKKIFSGEIWQGVIINKRKNGESYFSSSIVIPLKNDSGKLIGFVCNDEDITEEITTNQKLKETSFELKNKNEELISSFRYAHKIQENLMSDKNKLASIFEDFFILFLPKEIVSGDFYWTYQANNIAYIALADCTGHGVPGAFLSILGVTILESAFNEQKLVENNEIINYISKKFRAFVYNPDDTKNVLRDNMEISLISVDKSQKQISYSGARSKAYFISTQQEFKSDNNKMIDCVIKDENFCIYCLKADRHYLSTYFDYKQVKFNYNQFDEIILTTDGYIDQFSSITNKKFKRNNFEAMIYDMAFSPLKEQKKILLNNFIEFKAEEEQTDDITVIGINLDV